MFNSFYPIFCLSSWGMIYNFNDLATTFLCRTLCFTPLSSQLFASPLLRTPVVLLERIEVLFLLQIVKLLYFCRVDLLIIIIKIESNPSVNLAALFNLLLNLKNIDTSKPYPILAIFS